MSVWEMAASGAPGMTQLTTGDNNDLWPVIDSDPKPRLFYQAHLDMRDLPKLFMTQLGTVARTDLTHLGGTQPRISPKADTLIFAAPNAKTGKRDLFRMPDSGGVPENMTNTPDIDEFDPAWSSDGTRIAFVSDRGMDADKRANYDIWTIDAANSTQPTQVTANGSWDDSPTWDPSGDAIYFRSNRGGEWAIWKINMR
jgi:TolB protein